MDTAANKVLHDETIDKWEVHLQSPIMEEGALACSTFLLAKLYDSVIVYEVIISGAFSASVVLRTSNQYKRQYVMPCAGFK